MAGEIGTFIYYSKSVISVKHNGQVALMLYLLARNSIMVIKFTMKNKFFYILLGTILMHGVFAQANKQQLSNIEIKQQEIKNNIESFQKIVEIKDSSQYRYVFMKDKKPQLITVHVEDHNIGKYVEWFFYNGHVIYAEQIWINNSTGDIIDNEKLYADNSELIAWIKTDNETVDTTSEEFESNALLVKAYWRGLEAKYASTSNGNTN
jgi:hypothetical protein